MSNAKAQTVMPYSPKPGWVAIDEPTARLFVALLNSTCLMALGQGSWQPEVFEMAALKVRLLDLIDQPQASTPEEGGAK